MPRPCTPRSSAFDDAFNLNSGTKGITCDNAQLAAAGHLLRPFMIRRTKGEVEKRMPPKLETTITCPLSDMQLFWYKRLLLRESSLLKQVRRAPRTPACAPNRTRHARPRARALMRSCARAPDTLRHAHATLAREGV